MEHYTITINGEPIEYGEEGLEFDITPIVPAKKPEADCAAVEDAPLKNGRVCVVKAYVSRTELDLIKKAAGHTAVSSWARNQLLRGTGQKYPVEIRTGDLDEIRRLLSDYNLHANGFLAGLRYRSCLYQSDIDRMTELMETLNHQVQEALRIVKTDRRYEKKKTEREIDIRLKQIEARHQLLLESGLRAYGSGREGRRS